MEMGPVVRVLLREPLNDEQFRAIDQWLIKNSRIIEGIPGNRDVWIDSNVFPDSPDGEPCCITVMIQGYAPYVEPIYYPDEVRAVLGYLPAQVIQIDAGCNHRLDHYQIGHLALYLAGQYDGIIDMLGEISPPLLPDREYPMEEYPWHTLEEVRAFVQDMPGTIWEVFLDKEYKPVLNHMVDTVFLEAWLHHPHFHM
jgi:Family of unknown function (DUF6368)